MTDLTDKEAVLAANQAFYRAFGDLDLRVMTSLWWQGSTSLCIHPGSQPILGWEEIRHSWESIFRNTDSLEIDIEIVQVEVDRSLAYVVVREIVLQSNRGRNMKAQSIATNIFQKMAQKWYLVSHHGSPIIR
ncbi:nuclear transport factor 2 family protein [Pleurocapsales cyanobacterium LEGE 10410]|nr:nuclear transport factor 2 family protein [Pleurocapsales cyanobacterium LEGE 10410]